MATTDNDDEKPDPHWVAYFRMIQGLRDGYEEAHGSDESYSHEAFAYALVLLLVDHIRDHREADRPAMLEDYRKELALALMPDDEYVPPVKARH